MTPDLLEPLRPVAERIGWTLVHSVWQGAAAAAALGIALLLIPRAAARARYAASCAALLALLVAMAVTYSLTSASPLPSATATASAAPLIVTDLRAAPPIAPSTPLLPHATPSPLDFRDRLTPWLPTVAATWSLGVLALAAWHFGGWLSVRRLTRTGTPSSDWDARLRPLAARLRVTRPVRVIESAATHVPAVVGFLRPIILLPLGLAADLSPAQINAILAHELAHVRRNDYLANLVQTAIETLLFYHPAVWWVSARIRQEREHCCDDLALAATADDRAAYARALTRIEERHATTPSLAPAATGGHLLTRIRRILTPDRAIRHPRRATPLAALLVAATCTAALLLSTRWPAHAAEPAAKPPAINPSSDTTPSKDQPRRPLPRLHELRDQLTLELSTATQQLGPQHPRILSLKRQLDLVESQIQQAAATQPATVPSASANAPSPILPEDLAPLAGDYRISPSDLVEFRIMDLTGPGVETVKQLRVTQSGKISLPYVGELPVAGLTPAEAEKAIAKAFLDKKIVQDAQVSVQVTEARGSTFSVLGTGIAKPGEYPLTRGDLRLAEALAQAGGASSSSTVRVVRGKGDAQRQFEVTMKSLLAGDQAVNLVLRPGDMLLVSEPAPTTIRIVVTADNIIHNGRAVELASFLESLRTLDERTRARTTFEIGAGSPDLPIGRFLEVFGACANTARDLGMPPISNVGIVPAQQARVTRGEYYVGGLVGAPGAYSLAGRKIRLSQALISARLPDEGRKHYVTVLRRTGDKAAVVADRVLIEDLLTRRAQDIDLQPNDTLHVTATPTTAPAPK